MYTIERDVDREAVIITVHNTSASGRQWTDRVELTRYYHRGEGEINYRLLRDPDDGLARWHSRCQMLRVVDEEALTTAEKTLYEVEYEKALLVEAGHHTWQYNIARKLSEETGLPSIYKTDLTYHDAYRFAVENPHAFGFILREAGTWMVTARTPWKFVSYVTGQAASGSSRYYVILRETFLEVTAEFLRDYFEELRLREKHEHEIATG